MADRVNSSVSNVYSAYFYEPALTPDETQTIAAAAETRETQPKPRKLPPVKTTVSFTALGCDTESKLTRAGYMAAAARAGIADVAAQSRFADQMLARNPQLVLNNSIDLDDAKVKSRLLNREVDFTIGETERAALEQFRDQYVKDGGKIRSNRNPTVDLRQAQTADAVANPLNSTPNTKFRVLLSNDGRPISEKRVLAQYAENQYGGGKLWGQNYQQIGELSADQDVKPKITNITRVGNKMSVEFELDPRDRAVVHENYKTVQAEVNRARAAYEDFANNNEVSSFLRGVFNGAVKSLKGTLNLILDLPGTMQALWQVVSDPVGTFKGLVDELNQTWEAFKNAPPSKKSEMLGELVGQAIVEILIGKGIGKAGGILAKTKAGRELLDKADALKSATTAKIAETFSDEAANAAANRLRQKFAGNTLYAGIPADMLADFAVVSANKIKNGAVKFADFAKQMVDNFGEKVKPYLEKIYRERMAEFGLADKIDETEIKSVKLAKLSQTGVYTTKIKWGSGNIDARPDGVGFWGKRTNQSNSRVNEYELKINPNNESYYIKHPDGRFVQFENLNSRTVQDGKLIMQVNNSIYRVYDKPAFLRTNILNEARKQVEAAKYNGLQVEWLISDRETISQLQRFFRENNIDIKLTYFQE